MRTSLILPLLLSALPLAPPISAQVESSSQLRMPPEHIACPVNLRAERRQTVVSREVDGKTIPTGQGLTLHFGSASEPSSARHLVSADITVYGYSSKAIKQLLPLQSRPEADLKEEFHLAGSSSAPLIEKTLWTSKIHGITSIELTRVSFSDGSSWQSTIPRECTIEPNPFVLVK